MSSSANIVHVSNGPSWQHGHGKICKMQKLKNFEQVPSYIEFARKS
jgi:hypothetical protein